MKKLTFLALAICFAMNTFAQVQVSAVSGPPCPHTFVMSDQYDDTWNGASVDILINGAIAYSTTGPEDGGSFTFASQDLAFDAASGDTIALGNWSSGSYDSEISWAILDGAGTEIAAGVFGDGTTEVTGYCPSCLDPTNLSVSGVTTNSAILNWDSDGSAFMIEIQGSGVPQGTQGAGGYVIGDVVPYMSTSVTLLDPQTGAGVLTSGTSYDFYVVNVCDYSADGTNPIVVNAQSEYAGPFTFTTECDAVTAFPYTEDFDTDWSCWSVNNADGDSNTWSQSATYITPRSGDYTAHGMGNNDDYLISPKFSLTGNERVIWYDIVESAANNNTYDVLLSTSGKEISDFTVNLGTYDCTSTSWTEHILDLSAYSGDVYIALHQTFSAATYYGFGVDDFTVEEIPSIPPGCASNFSDTLDTSCGNNDFSISWDAATNADGYYISVGTTSGGTDIEALIDLGNITTYDFTSPTIATTYYYTVLPYNAVGSASGCTEQTLTTVETGCHCISIPTSNDGSGISSVSFGANVFEVEDVEYKDLTATAVSIGQSTSASLEITFATGFGYDTHVWVDLNDDYDFSSDELMFSGESTGDNPTTLDASFLVPSDAPLGNHRVRIGTADTGQGIPDPCYNGSYGVTIDMTITVTEPPLCLAPTNLSVSEVTTTSATLNWDSDGNAFMIEIQGSGVPQGTQGAGGYVIGDVDPYPLTSVTLLDPDTGAGVLTSNTSYDFWVVNVCADGNSEYAGPFTFTTLCDTVTVFPYSHGFEDLACWSNSDSSAAWALDDGSDFGPGSVTEGVSAVFFNDYDYSSGSTSDLMSPNLDLSALTVARLSFDYYDGGGTDTVDVLVDSGSGPVVVYTTDATVSTWTTIEIDLPEYAGQTIQIGFRGSSIYGTSNPHIDNLMVAEAPSCLAPSDLVVSSITTTTASVAWTANNSETAWEYQLVETGVAPEDAGTATVDNPLSLSNLTDNTAYDVYVRANCGTDFSAWSMVTFTTLPAPIVPDYMNDFATYPGDLWSEGEGALADGPSGTSSAWATDGFANDGFSGAARVNVYHSSFSGGNNDWLISPVFDLSVGSYYLNLDAAATEYGSSTLDAVWGSEDYTALMISEDAGQTWTELYRWDATNSPGLAGAAMPEVDLSVYTGLATFALYAESFDSVEDVDFFVDNFSIGSTSLSLNDVSTVSNFTFFPNPVNNVLTIKAQASIDSITVYNMLGQTVVRSTPNTNDCTVDMSLLQSGAYFVQVSINNTLKTVRVIKN